MYTNRLTWNVCNHGNIGLDVTNHKPTCTLHYTENPHLTVKMCFKQNALNACIYHMWEIFAGAKFCRDVSTLRTKFSWFFCRMNAQYSGHNHTRWRPCHPCKLKKRDEEWQSEEASLYNGPVFHLCEGLCNYETIKTALTGEKLAGIQHCWSWLWHLQGVS